MRGGLTLRMIVAGCVLALVVGTAFAVLLSSVADLRGSQERAQQSEETLLAAYQLERLVVDLETGERGFVITGRNEFLEPWSAARAAIPGQAATLERLVAGNGEQSDQAHRIVRAINLYLRDYSLPLVAAARRDPGSARTVAVSEDGRRRLEAIRGEFDRLIDTEQSLAVERQRHSLAAAARASAAAAAGLAVSLLIIGAVIGYLSSAIVRPVRRAAVVTGRLAGGDLSARLPDGGVGEIGVLQRSFNMMARSLQDSREELAASRARIVAAADHARRRIERDLHDGTQQRLVSLALEMRNAESAVPAELQDVRAQLTRVADGLAGALDDLREIARGIHPAILSEGGLGPALRALARRSATPVELEVDVATRLPEATEVAAYYVVSEALANTAKHAHAALARVDAYERDGILHLSIRDDGIGGAAIGPGSGLTGLADRVEALGGTLRVESPSGKGTAVLVDLPIQARTPGTGTGAVGRGGAEPLAG
jgi:signal transduction histidine kinase